MTLEHDVLDGLPFVVRAPTRPATPKPPVLCFLHGHEEGAPAPLVDGVTRHGPLRDGSSARAEEFIVVAPQLPVRGDLWYRHAQTICDLALRACNRFGGERGRMYLTGFSFGGNGVFDLAREPGSPWAALWAVDPPRVPSGAVRQPVWLSIGAAARRGERAFIDALHLLAFDGDLAKPRLYLDERGDHVESAKLAYADDRVYDWLLEWRMAP